MKAGIACRLVRLASWPIDRSYVNMEMKRQYREQAWVLLMRCITNPCIKLALRIDNQSAAQQMIEECWWG